MRAPAESAADARERRLLGSHGRYYLFVAPAALVFLGFVAWPIASVLFASFTVRDTASLGDDLFSNYRAVVNDPVFWTALRNMVIWAILTVGIQMLVGGTLAYLIETHARRAKTILRTAFLIPMVTSASVVAIVWAQFYAPILRPAGGGPAPAPPLQ